MTSEKHLQLDSGKIPESVEQKPGPASRQEARVQPAKKKCPCLDGDVGTRGCAPAGGQLGAHSPGLSLEPAQAPWDSHVAALGWGSELRVGQLLTLQPLY